MARASTIRVMISSRCNDHFPAKGDGGRPLSEIRRNLKQEIESLEVFGKQVFEVWINEETPPQGGSWDSWDVCMEAVRDCDVLLVLSNGNAGWARAEGDIGICHAELMNGLAHAAGKVRLISLGDVATDESADGQRNRRFQEYVGRQSLFRGGEVKTKGQLVQRAKEALHDALIRLAQQGVREASKGRFHSGQALDWSRMSFQDRQAEMRGVLAAAIGQRSTTKEVDGHLLVELADTQVLLCPHAIPAALSDGAAKEMVGQPFLRDHERADVLTDKRGGPVHVIACHKAATELQATKLLGFSDATVVRAPFGIYVADNVQKIQFAFIVDCRDEANTRHGVQRFFEWLEQTGEADLLARRARSRAKIVRAIADEVGA